MADSASSETGYYMNKFDKEKDAESSVRVYDDWAKDYEKNLLSMKNGYSHPRKIAEVAARFINDRSAKILDLCAGTGLGGEALKELGYTNIDALDGSAAMLKLAKEKNVYANLYEEIIDTERVKSVQPGTYDAIVTSGSFVPGHLGPGHLRPVMQLLRPGGLFCMALRTSYLEEDCLRDLEPTMLRMQQQGCWQLLEKSSMPNYFDDLPGSVYVYRRL